MTKSDADSGPPPAGQFDLEALIGDVRRESARLRASPSFPVDREAVLGVELDRLAPAPSRPRLERMADVVEALGRSEPVSSIPWTRRRADKSGTGRALEMTVVMADALRLVSGRLSDIERRLQALQVTPVTVTKRSEGGPDLDIWREEATVGARPGRILCGGLFAANWADELARSGKDVYALGAGAESDLVSHLERVADAALGAVLVVGPIDASRTGLSHLALELTRTALLVRVIDEAPWWWASRLGAHDSDLAATRPLHPDTWIALMDGAGYTATGRYSPDGRSYLVSAGPRP